jgi:hypothetical protein
METDSFLNKFRRRLSARKNYDLFGCDNFENIHWGKLFIHLFGEYYSRYSILRRINNEGLIDRLIKHYSLKSNQVIRIDRVRDESIYQVDYGCSEVLLILKKGFMIGIIDCKIDLIYGTNISEAERLVVIKLVDEYQIADLSSRVFHMIQQSNGYLELADFDVKPFEIDLDSHYNDDFGEIHKKIIESLSAKDKNGLILLHGKYGSGKTYYIRHLISNINRKFIYFPASMINSISSPEFLPFISRQPNTILILEDCESLLVHRENGQGNGSALSNLLNLGDGLLSDALSINVICTFNAAVKKIDDAILRKGRILARYEFKELELYKARELSQKLGKKGIIDKPMTVSDIYNIDDTGFENKPAKSIGFKAA